jgi:hypothetical protein
MISINIRVNAIVVLTSHYFLFTSNADSNGNGVAPEQGALATGIGISHP